MMVSSLIKDEELSNTMPDGALDYQQNCAAMAFSRVLGISWAPAVNLFIRKGWATNANAMQYDSTIAAIVAGLPLTRRANNETWLELKPRLSSLPDGRYFAVNTGIHDFGGKGVGHAFAIIKKGGWGTAANNSEKTDENYGSSIPPGAKISVWGPA
jgi:hypothetical protein